jgi:hypothetical protein
MMCAESPADRDAIVRCVLWQPLSPVSRDCSTESSASKSPRAKRTSFTLDQKENHTTPLSHHGGGGDHDSGGEVAAFLPSSSVSDDFDESTAPRAAKRASFSKMDPFWGSMSALRRAESAENSGQCQRSEQQGEESKDEGVDKEEGQQGHHRPHVPDDQETSDEEDGEDGEEEEETYGNYSAYLDAMAWPASSSFFKARNSTSNDANQGNNNHGNKQVNSNSSGNNSQGSSGVVVNHLSIGADENNNSDEPLQHDATTTKSKQQSF